MMRACVALYQTSNVRHDRKCCEARSRSVDAMAWNVKADVVHAACATAAALVAGVALKTLVKYLRPSLFITSFQGKHVFVTGGSSGIGLEIARKALAEGAFVSILSRSETNLSKARTDLLKTTGCSSERLFVKAVDVGDAPAITAAVQEAFTWKPIDVLICNAGIVNSSGHFQDLTLAQIEEVVRINLLGSIYTAHAAIPLMIQRSASNPSSILFMNSLGGLVTFYKASPYSASKHGLRGLAEVLRVELLPYNIRVTVVYPGYTETPMLDVVRNSAENKETLDIQTLSGVNESAEDVATSTLNAVKRGRYHVLTKPWLAYPTQFSRGAIPPDTFWESLMETVTYIPSRLARAHLHSFIKNAVLKKHANDTRRQQAGTK